MKLFSCIFMSFFSGIYCIDLPTCDIGELQTIDPNGLCNSDHGDQNCSDYCHDQYGIDALGAMCSAPRNNSGLRECICNLKCCNGACCHSSKCWNLDISKSRYQGWLKRHLITPCTKFTSFPHFEVRQINQVWPIQSTNISELVVPDWGIILDIQAPDGESDNFKLRVNDTQETIPYEYSTVHDYRENYIRVYYVNNHRNQVLVKTSFGLNIKLISLSDANGFWQTSITVYTPAHPDLRSNICGLLGGWTDISTGLNASVGNQTLDPGFSVTYFENWIVTEGGTPEELSLEEQKQLRKLCQQNLRGQMFTSCATYFQIPLPTMDDCDADLSHITNQTERQEFLKSMVSIISDKCNISALIPSTCCTQQLTPLHRLYDPKANFHFYTSSANESNRLQTKSNYLVEGVAGIVSSTGSPRRCGKFSLRPIHRMRNKKNAERVYLSDRKEINLATRQGYAREGVAFYCASVPGLCGADIAFHRYWAAIAGEHFYTQNMKEGNENVLAAGGTYKGVLCYIWPSPPSL